MQPDPNRYHPGNARKPNGANVTESTSLQRSLTLPSISGISQRTRTGDRGAVAANSLGCEVRQVSSSSIEGRKYIKFLTHRNVVGVAYEEEKCWRLDGGRVAKKKTEGEVWKWHDGPKYIKFLTHGNVVGVAHEEKTCWGLDGGRVAKKRRKKKFGSGTMDLIHKVARSCYLLIH